MSCSGSRVFLPPFRSRRFGLPTARVSHSEILGSQLVCSSPRLIAAYHVLHRLPVPRHPPCALTRLISVSRCDSSTPHTPLVSCQRAKKENGRSWKVRATNPVPSDLRTH